MHGQTDISERVFYFGAIVEAEPANEFVAQATAAADFFKSARLKIGAVLHGAGLRGIVVENAFELAGDEFGFGMGVAAFEVFQVAARAVFGAEGFAEALGIIGYDGSSGIENLLRGAVVAFEFDDAGGREVARKAHEDGDVGAAPTINGLVFVADDADVLLWTGEEAQEIVLHAVGVLIFIDVDVLEAGLPLFADGGGFAQQLHATQQEIVKIESVAFVEQLFVGGVDVGDLASIFVDRAGAKIFGRLAVVLGIADAAENVARRERVVVDLQVGHGQLDGGELVVVIVDGEIAREAGIRRFAAKKAGAKRMKGGEPGLRGRHAGAQQQVRDAIAHFLGGFVGEGDREDGFGGDTAGNEIGHAEGDGASLAGSGSGEKEHRTFRCFGGNTLLRVQFVEKT